jgi:hypothetical protein
MTIKGRAVLSMIGALGLILAGAGPALAQHSGGGHGGGGGGGHAGGGHASYGGHAAAGHMGGAHYAGPSHFAGPAHFGATTSHGYPAAVHGYAGHSVAYAGHGYSTAWHGGSGWHGAYWGGWHGAYWHGGWWHGGYWPVAWYGPGWAWFLPVLPLAYATYWWGGIPYYYANDVYYTWNPSYGGYVATDPPPVADSSGVPEGSAVPPADAGAPPGPGPGGPVAGQIFMYPKNGQSAEQQAVDRAECQKWAESQAGQVAQNGSDYNRAMVACVEGRGYSAR